MAPTSKLSAKARTVLPKSVRERLGVNPGDTVRYRETEDGIVIEKADGPEPADDPTGDPFAAFTEWATSEEDDAWKDL